MDKIKIRIERTRGGFPALREVLESAKFLVVCNEKGQRKRSSSNKLVKIEPKNNIIVAINCGGEFRISIYEILEIENDYMYVREVNRYKDGVWSEIITQQQQLEKTIIETINLINGSIKND